MGNDEDGARSAGGPIPVPELRDYHQINAEVVRRLDRGESRIRLDGPAGHRLLLAGLDGTGGSQLLPRRRGEAAAAAAALL